MTYPTLISSIWLCIIFNLVAANTPIPNSVFLNDPLSAVRAAAPLWHMDVKTCFPSSAVTSTGAQTPSLENDFCGLFEGGLDARCPVQAPQTQQEQLSTPFPTYYTIRYCEADNSWRVVYDVFFQKVREKMCLSFRRERRERERGETKKHRDIMTGLNLYLY